MTRQGDSVRLTVWKTLGVHPNMYIVHLVAGSIHHFSACSMSEFVTCLSMAGGGGVLELVC